MSFLDNIVSRFLEYISPDYEDSKDCQSWIESVILAAGEGKFSDDIKENFVAQWSTLSKTDQLYCVLFLIGTVDGFASIFRNQAEAISDIIPGKTFIIKE